MKTKFAIATLALAIGACGSALAGGSETVGATRLFLGTDDEPAAQTTIERGVRVHRGGAPKIAPLEGAAPETAPAARETIIIVRDYRSRAQRLRTHGFYSGGPRLGHKFTQGFYSGPPAKRRGKIRIIRRAG